MGPRPVAYKMPELAGVSLNKAVLMIEAANLTVGEIRSHFDKNKPRNIILQQEPLAGHRINENSPIRLVINRHTGKTAGAQRHRPLYGSLLQHRVKNGFLKKRIRVELESEDSAADKFDDYIKPGEEVWVLIPREQDTRAFIFEDDTLVNILVYEAW